MTSIVLGYDDTETANARSIVRPSSQKAFGAGVTVAASHPCLSGRHTVSARSIRSSRPSFIVSCCPGEIPGSSRLWASTWSDRSRP